MIKNTGDAFKNETRLFSGYIRKINIDIPEGHFYSAGLRFEFEGAEASDNVLPKREQGAEIYFMGNDDHINLTPNIKITQGSMKIFGANGDLVNNHEFVITIEIEKLETSI
jgi:hypothetical protein